ncbi:hypothetical protein FOB41_15030 [Agrobacterium pusense]|uniref:Uncharacterized protein n=1 Tax=Agrobacterium pusense TaxID=648995 RepID=A0A6H0ZP04_9HYPH|nr:hypothetical protein [Agrobacterium pusense]QIX22369.1 hypothetical protein FOB41_15030 [Agrobacterium pusense]
MKRSFIGNFYRSFGANIRANRADADAEEGRLLRAEHRKPEFQRPRKLTYDEIMEALSDTSPSTFLDRKVQAYLSVEEWPPTSMDTSYHRVAASGEDNAWSTSVPGVSKLMMVSHPDVWQSLRLEFGPYRATFSVDGSTFQVRAKSAASTMMMAHIVAGRIRHHRNEASPDLGPNVAKVQN